MGMKADVMLMMVAVPLMFTIISLHGLEKAREPRPPAWGAATNGGRGATESEKRTRNKGEGDIGV